MYKLSKFSTSIGLLGLMVTLTSCLQRSSSSLDIDSGLLLTKESKNNVTAVVQVTSQKDGKIEGLCTGTIVSTNTVLTAAHCLVNTPKVCVSNSLYNACATKILSHNAYRPDFNNPDSTNDLGILIFDGHPFNHYFPVSRNKAMPGQKVVMIGYSPDNLADQSKGSKRWGYNTIQRLQYFRGDSIISRYRVSKDGVAVSPGDSGGALLAQCQVIGVASALATVNSFKVSIHTNVTQSANSSWLDQITSQGGHVCRTNEENEKCPAQGRFKSLDNPPQEANGQEGFPCGSNAENQNMPISVRASGKDSSKYLLYFTSDKGDHSYGYCEGLNAEQCKPGVGGYKKAAFITTVNNGRKIYRIVENNSLNDPAKIWSFVIYDKDGKLLDSRSVIFSVRN